MMIYFRTSLLEILNMGIFKNFQFLKDIIIFFKKLETARVKLEIKKILYSSSEECGKWGWRSSVW